MGLYLNVSESDFSFMHGMLVQWTIILSPVPSIPVYKLLGHVLVLPGILMLRTSNMCIVSLTYEMVFSHHLDLWVSFYCLVLF